MKILLIRNDCGGFADHIDVSDGITVSELLLTELNDSLDLFVVKQLRKCIRNPRSDDKN